MANLATPVQFDQTAQMVTRPQSDGADAGQAIQGAGDLLGKFADARLQLRNETNLTGAKISAVGQLQDLAQQFRSDPDPATAPQRFQDAANKIGSDLGEQFSSDPQYANRWNAEFGDLMLSHRAAVSENAWTQQKSDAAASIDQANDTFARTAAYAPNPQVRAAAITGFAGTVNQFVAQGLYNAKDGQRLLDTFKGHLAQYDAENAIDQNPSGAADALRNPNTLPDLDPLTRIQMVGRADAAVRQDERDQRMEAAEARRAAAEQMRDLRENARIAVQDFNIIGSTGKPIAQPVIDATEHAVLAANNPVLTHEFSATLRGVAVVQGTQGANPQQIMGAIAQNNADIQKSGGTDLQHAVVDKMLHERLDHVSTQAQNDPLKLASDEAVAPIVPLKLDGSDSPADFKARIGQANMVASRYQIAPVYLTKAEQEQLKAQVDPNADPAAQIKTLTGVVSHFGSAAPSVLSHLGIDAPVAAHVGGMIASGGDATAARDALTGQKLMQSKAAEEYTPTEAVRAASAAARSAGWFSAASPPSGAPNVSKALAFMPQDFARASATADAIYTARAQRLGITKASLMANPKPGEALYGQAFNLALGAHYAPNGARRGGMASYNGYPVVVGQHVNPDFFEDAIHALSPTDVKAASASGKPPLGLGGDHPLDGKWLISAGDGRYYVSTTDPSLGAPQRVTEGDGRTPFVLSVTPSLFARLHQRGVDQP